MSIATPPTSPFLQGLLAPVFDERDDRDLSVTGRLPEGLQGMFVRNGPNPQFAPKTKYHPFDGDGMMHAVYFEDGKARYRNKWIESKGLVMERERGEALYGTMGEFAIPPADVVERAGVIKNTSNTHSVRHGGKILALMEACLPTELDRELNTIGEWDYDGRLKGAFTAHPKVDPFTGEMLFFGYSPFPPYVRYHVVAADGTLVHSVDLDLPNPIMMHDFVVTEDYAIFLDSPVVFDVKQLAAGGGLTRWAPEEGTRIGVLPRRGGSDDIRWFEIDNQYIVHFFNAWNDGNRIEVRAPRFSRMPGGFDFEAPQGGDVPMPWSWSIDLDKGTVSHRQADDRGGEFPRVNDNLATRRTRYLYNSMARTWEFEFEFHGVVKYDEETGGAQEHFYAESEVSGEHVFVPDPNGSAEDDGWLMSFVTDRATDTTDLVVLDAHDITAEPVARVHIPRRVPIGFHANWFPEG